MITDRRPAILVVEDDEQLRKSWCAVLRLDGFHTHEASDGLEAILVLDRTVIDAVVIDVALSGLDAVAVCKEIASQFPTLPLIVVTDSDAPLKDVNPTWVLRTPATSAEVAAAVRQCLRASRIH